MKKGMMFSLLFALLMGCAPNYNLKSKKSQLDSVQLVDGSIQLENPKLKVVVSPKFGGRVVSLQDKRTSEEVVLPVNPKFPDKGGAFCDIVDLKQPGEGNAAYEVQKLGLSKSEDLLELSLSRVTGKVLITKTYSLDAFSASLTVRVSLKNISGKDLKISYWNQSCPILGKSETNGRMTWIRLKGDITNLSFIPSSGAKDGIEMVPQNGFVALNAKDSKLAAFWTFDADRIAHFWSWNEKDTATFDLVFQTENLKHGQETDYSINLTLVPAMQLISDVDGTTGIGGYMKASAKGGLITGKGELFKYTKDKIENVELRTEILSPSGEVAQVLKSETIPAVFPEEMMKTEFQEKISNNIYGGHYRIRMQLLDEDENAIYSTTRTVDFGRLKIPKKSKDLKMTMLWQMHVPIYSDITKTKQSLKYNVGKYRKLIDIYRKHPKMKADIAISGALLYQLAQFYPDIIKQIKGLVKTKQFTVIGTAFAMPLFPFVSSEQINYQLQLDKGLKKFLLGVKPQGGMLSEMAFRDGFFDALFKNDIRWIYFAQGPLEKGYSGIPGLDYQQPSKLISTGYPMNILLQDRTWVDLMRSDSRYKEEEVIQYLLEVNAVNDGKKVLVFADKVENYSDFDFLDGLLTKMGKISWIKMMSGGDVFKKYEPTQTFLGEKIEGDWNTLPDETGNPFARYFSDREQTDLWTELSNKEVQVLGVGKKIKEAEDFGVDVSYPRSLLNEVWQNLLISAQSDWFISRNKNELAEAGVNLSVVKQKTAEVYENLMKILKDEELSIPLVSEVGEPLEKAFQESLFTKISSDLFDIQDVGIVPTKPTPVSAVNLYFKIYDKKNGIDYNNVYVVYHINDTDKYFRTKAKFMFDGRMKAFLGKTKAGFKVEYFIFAKDVKNTPSISKAYSYDVPKE